MASDKAGDKPEHEELDFVPVIRLAQLGKEAISVVLRVIKRVNRQKVFALD